MFDKRFISMSFFTFLFTISLLNPTLTIQAKQENTTGQAYNTSQWILQRISDEMRYYDLDLLHSSENLPNAAGQTTVHIEIRKRIHEIHIDPAISLEEYQQGVINQMSSTMEEHRRPGHFIDHTMSVGQGWGTGQPADISLHINLTFRSTPNV